MKNTEFTKEMNVCELILKGKPLLKLMQSI